jgi:hypothetical protein
MDVRMEHTRGLGQAAEVWVAGTLLTVCDGISESDNRRPPGEIEDARFRYVCESPPPLSDAVITDGSRQKGLEPVKDWAYLGVGQIVSIMPVVIDFGLLQMEDPRWETAESLVGRYVQVDIDRLEITPAHEPDWPDGAT